VGVEGCGPGERRGRGVQRSPDFDLEGGGVARGDLLLGTGNDSTMLRAARLLESKKGKFRL
jgi:hypothetical protein